MNIQKRFGFMFVCAIVGVANFASSPVAFAKELANVNGHSITDLDLNQSLDSFNEGQKESFLKDSNARLSLLQGLVDHEVLFQETTKLKMDQGADFKKSIELIKKQMLVNQLLDQKLSDKVTPAELKKYYNLHKDIYSTSQVHVQQILVSDESEAKRIKKLAEEKPGEFLELAEKYSKDPAVKKNRGDLGFVSHDRLVKNFTDVAFATPDGKVAGPIKTIYGYHVIKVIEKVVGKPLGFAEVELRVKDAMRVELIRDYTDKLRSLATIKVDEASILKP